MIFGAWKTQGRRRRKSEALYRAIMTQTRRPEFYVNGGVADTFEGRFDLLVLHVTLVLYRLKAEGEEGKALGQNVFDLLFADMDAALREMGVGDTSVPKRIRQMSEAFYGRLEAYDAGLAAEDEAPLREAVERNLYGSRAPAVSNVAIMADYMRETVRHMQKLPLERLEPGALFQRVPNVEPVRGSLAKGVQ